MWVTLKPAIPRCWCQALEQQSMRVIKNGGAAFPGKTVYLLATFWGSRCDLECAGALQGKAKCSCVIQGEGYRGASALALSLVRPGDGPRRNHVWWETS